VDAIELGRRRAAELHAAAVARGLDPNDPYAFAVGVAKDRGLDVDTANPGAAVLDNGRATLVPEDALIVHENVGSPFERAFLIAHEIGHHELGDANGQATVIEVDPARASEPSPTGIDRVVDYGRRQRREVQMDLFGRELLMPRALVRRLHLEEGLTATAIAERMNAPFDAVAQQLFDALLLPVIESDRRVSTDKPLNVVQAAAAAHRGGPYILEAGPGTGKTQTLTARVVQLIDEGVDPRRLLVLTYSNKAAGEMAERIAKKRPEQASAIWTGTFHAFGLDLIRRLGPEFMLRREPRLMDRVEAVELLEVEFPRLALEHYLDLYDPMPGTSCATRCAGSANGPSKSSSGPIPRKASSCCPGAGSSSERWHGSTETGVSPRTSNRPSRPQPHGSSSHRSSSLRVVSQDYEITPDNLESGSEAR
jgi:Zn-dependent peptidase ImmA (M78 family)